MSRRCIQRQRKHTDPEIVSPAQGILKMPREGDILVEINGNSVANHEIAVNLIQSTERPVTLGFVHRGATASPFLKRAWHRTGGDSERAR